MPRISLEQYVRRWAPEAQIIGDCVMVRERTWHARHCPCGHVACDGWSMVPARNARDVQ